MELTFEEVQQSQQALTALLNTAEALPVRFTIAAKFNMAQLKEAASEFEEFRSNAMEETAEYNENGQVRTTDDGEIIFKSEEEQSIYVDEIRSKLDETTEINLKTVDPELFTSQDANPQLIFMLDWMFE